MKKLASVLAKDELRDLATLSEASLVGAKRKWTLTRGEREPTVDFRENDACT